MVVANAFIVEKAKKVLDFTLTVFFYHLIFTWISYGLPNFYFWWIVQAQLITTTVVLSEMLCMKIETSEIKLSINDILERGKESATQIISEGKRIIESKKNMTDSLKKSTSNQMRNGKNMGKAKQEV